MNVKKYSDNSTLITAFIQKHAQETSPIFVDFYGIYLNSSKMYPEAFGIYAQKHSMKAKYINQFNEIHHTRYGH
jgi:hypothetical protein